MQEAYRTHLTGVGSPLVSDAGVSPLAPRQRAARVVDDTPFFIVGSQRSGTTLLRLIIARHSRIHIPPETWFIGNLVSELPLTGALTPSQVGRAVDIMTSHYRWQDMQIAAQDFRSWAHALEAPQLVDIINLLYRHHLKVRGKPRFGDKTPDYIDIIPQLCVLYPGAKFIHLIRDGRDVAISHLRLDLRRYYDRKNFDWIRAMAWRREYSASPFADRILDVRYEDLVGNIEATVAKICTFLGEEFEPQMLEWQSSVADMLPERGVNSSYHSNLSQQLMREQVRGWEKKLSGVECFAMEACLHDDLRELGYNLRFAGGAWRPVLTVSGRLLFAAAPLLKRGVPYLKRRNLLPKTLHF